MLLGPEQPLSGGKRSVSLLGSKVSTGGLGSTDQLRASPRCRGLRQQWQQQGDPLLMLCPVCSLTCRWPFWGAGLPLGVSPSPPPPCCTFVAHSLKTHQSSQAVAGKTKAQTRECGGSNNGLSWVQLRRVGGTAAALRVTAGLHGPALLPLPCSFALFPSESPIQGSPSTGLPSPCLPNSMYPAKDPELTS